MPSSNTSFLSHGACGLMLDSKNSSSLSSFSPSGRVLSPLSGNPSFQLQQQHHHHGSQQSLPLHFQLLPHTFGHPQPSFLLRRLRKNNFAGISDSNKAHKHAHNPFHRIAHSTMSALTLINSLKQQIAAAVDPGAPHWARRAAKLNRRHRNHHDDSHLEQQTTNLAHSHRHTLGPHHRQLTPQQRSQQEERLGLQASRDCRIRDAIAHFQAAAEADPSNAKVLALLSKQWTDLTYAHGAVVEVKHAHHCNTKALEYAEAAVAADPRCMSARVACCVSKGRLALFVSDARTKVKLACDAQSDVKVAIELDPSNDTAHHLMGRWNYEMVQVNAFARTLVRIIYGASLMAGSYPEALISYRAAAALCPTCVIHPVEIGRTLLKLKQPEEAIFQLRHALTLTALDINDVLQHHAAEELLTELGVSHEMESKDAGSPSNSHGTETQQKGGKLKGLTSAHTGKKGAGYADEGQRLRRLTAADVWGMARPLEVTGGVDKIK